MGVEHQNCGILCGIVEYFIYGECKSYDFFKHGRNEIFNSDFISAKFSYSNERVSFAGVGAEY